jgi:uncharacterized membrane protein YphA (DoxX/SURF4 family)
MLGNADNMTMLRRLARPMLAAMFINGGLISARHPERVVGAAKSVVEPLAAKFSFVPDDVEQAVRINGATQVVAGSLLAIGKFPRIASLALAGTLVPTTWAAHRWWEHDDERQRDEQRAHFYKNLSMMGGLLLAVADTGGRPSVAWRASHRRGIARREAMLAAQQARLNATNKLIKSAGKSASKVAGARKPAKAATQIARAAASARLAKPTGKAIGAGKTITGLGRMITSGGKSIMTSGQNKNNRWFVRR